MEFLALIIPFILLVVIESLTVRWISGGQIPNLLSRIFATNVAGIVLLLLVSLTGWFLGWWPDIRNWALKDSFFLFLLVKAPIFSFLFRRWGFQKIFTLHVISNYVSVFILSILFVYSPRVIGINPVTTEDLNKKSIERVMEIKDALEAYYRNNHHYPSYIWGGDPLSWGGGKPSPDPLLNGGFLQAYPVNPYNLNATYFEPRRAPGLRALWFGTKSETYLRLKKNLWGPVVEEDPRFGYRGTKMGNVLPDPKMPSTDLPRQIKFTIDSKWLPGGFFYRAYDIDGKGKPDAYILGVCGDEHAEATVDCYDARTDKLTTKIDDIIVPSASDGIRDGVIYIIRRGFDRPRSPLEGKEIPRVIDPVTGEPVPQYFTEPPDNSQNSTVNVENPE